EDEDEVEDDDEEEEEEDVDLEGDEEEDDDEVDEDLEEEDEDLEEEDEDLEEDRFSQDTEEGGLSPTARRLKKQKGKGKAVVGKGKPGKQKTNLTSSKGKGKSSSAQGGGKRKSTKKTVSSTSKRGRSGVVKITPLTAQEHVEFDAASGSKPIKVTKAPKDKLTLSRAAQDSVDGIPLKAKGYFGFKFSHMEVEDGKIREKWTCLYCKDDKSVPKGKNNNLSNHRGCCPSNQNPKTAGLEPFYPKGLKRPSNEASNVSDTGGSYRGLPLMGWLSGQQILSVPLVRRMGLIEIVTDALPFTHMASPAHIALVSSIDPKAVAACVSNTSVRRDLELFNEQMKIEVMRTLNEHDSLVTLQHDAWTMRGYRFAFVAIIATYVDRDWNYRSLLLSFKVLDTRHSGANFAGHLVETIKEFHLEEKWSGLIVSDSASPNRRMAAVIQQQLADRGEKVRYLARCLHGPGEADGDEEAQDGSSNPFAQATHDIESSETPPSISAFPKASRRCNFVWRADDCGILCFAHHLNIAVRDGFRAMGIKFAAQMKVIPIPDIIEPSNGPGLQAIDDLEPAADEDERDAGVVAEEEDDEEVEEEIDTDPKWDNAPPLDERGEDDDDDDLVFLSAEERAAIMNRLGDGPPQENIDVEAGTGGAWSAVKRVEGFVVALHRSAERMAAFRAVVRKEYFDDPKKMNAAIPTKPNDTRWNSQVATLRSALRVKEAIDLSIAQEKDPKHQYKAFSLSDDDWKHVEWLVKFLQLAERISMKIQETKPTLCDVLEYHVLMVTSLDRTLRQVGDKEGADLDAMSATARDLRPEDAPHQIAAAIRAMKIKLGKYRTIAINNRATMLAALLHPQHRIDLFEADYPGYVSEAKAILHGAVKELKPSRHEQHIPASSTVSISDASPLKAAQQERMARVQERSFITSPSSGDPEEEEVGRYMRNVLAWRTTDKSPEQWWKVNESEFPTIAKLARIVLSAPGSTADVERVFSTAGWMISQRRGRVSGDTLGLLVTSHGWMAQGIDRLVGLDESARATGIPILKRMDATVANKKKKRQQQRRIMPA
ncbi:hypothetical protein A4X13_0g8666, partial [Tilletia indica]